MRSPTSATVHTGAVQKTSRRSSVRLLGISPAALLLSGLFAVWAGPLAAPAAAAGGDWTQFRNGATHEGYNAAETILSASSVPHLALAWKGAVNPDDPNPSYRVMDTSPAVANGVVYVGSRNSGKLFAYAVGCGTGGAICTPLWTASTDNWWIGSSPAVYSNGSSSQVFVTGTNGKLFAFDASGNTNCIGNPKTCTALWTANIGGSNNVVSPTVYNGVVYVASSTGFVYAFNPNTCGSSGASCTPLWTSAATGSAFHSSPAVANGVVYIGADDGNLYVYSATGTTGCSGGTCSPLWTGTASGAISSSPAVSGGKVYVGSGDGRLHVFDANGSTNCSGIPKTCSPTLTYGIGGASIDSSPAVVNGVVYYGVGSNLQALDTLSMGNWYATTGAHVNSSPAVADGVVYVGSQDGKLYAYAVGCNSNNGACSPVWTYTTGGAIHSSPAVANGVVYVGSDDGYLYAFDLPLDHLVLSPANLTIPAGWLRAFTAQGADAYGTLLGDLTYYTTFTISGGDCFEKSCYSTVAGDHTVTGTDGTVTGTTTLHVTPAALDHLVLSPANATVGVGGSQTYTAEGFDAYGNSLGDVTGSTTFTGSGSASCTANSCTSTAAGDHTVTGTNGAATGTATLHVNAGTLNHLVLSPAKMGITAGASETYAAQGADVYGNSLGVLTTSTTFTISGGGSCTGATCTSTTAGDHTVTGTDGTVTGTTTLHVTPAALDHLVLSPANATVAAGVHQAYTAEGFDAYDNSLGDVTSGTTFTTSGFGTCAGASCWSNAPGEVWVSGRYSSAFAMVFLHVTPTSGATYHAITPTRVLDTRNGTGGLAGPFTNHVARTFTVSGIPASATAVTGNLTVTGQTSSGYLFIGPVATNNPGSSTLNFPVGDDRANAVTVALGAGGTLSITFVAPSNGPTAHAIFDVTGYFTPDVTGATYHALTPTRALDTRNGTGGMAGPFTNHAARTFQVTGGSSGVPTGATAVTGNLTVTGQTSSGYLFIGPVATNNPSSSTLNFPVGDDRANAVTVALGTGGTLSITFVAPSNGPTAHAIFDVTGYFTGDMSGASYHPLTPTRILDTRNGTGGLSGPFGNHAARAFGVTGGSSGVPANATAVTGNLTVTGQTSSGYLFIGPVATNNPGSSTLNFPVGDDRANAVTVALGGGSLSITFVAPSNGPTAHAIFDVTGYFTP